MPTTLSINPNRAIDLIGRTVSGALATFYDAGTTRVRTVYADPACEIPHPTPLPANGAGVFPPVFDADDGDVSVRVTDGDGVTLPGYPLSPVVKVTTDLTGANAVSFAPTPEIPEDNVQDAIERVQKNAIAPLAAFGIGVTGNTSVLADINATNIASGAYRFDGATLGIFPAGVTRASGGTVRIWRRTASSALMILTPNGSVRQSIRELSGGSWSAWDRILTTDDTAPNSVWAAGTSTQAYAVTPENVAAANKEIAIGHQQAWATPARTLGTVYTNDTSRPIQVSVTVDGAPGSPGQFFVRTSSTAAWVAAAIGTNDTTSLCVIVPPGHQYRVTAGDTLFHWAELR